ncbi:metal ABC transporter substrate-binding protein [Ruminococcaceae bacterium OttesenSCG-928-A16]|nr:metal ABC transporter substrate-binding protein [Ruminococcaceae bacterium OttesenSCG-928-A16]
MKKIFAILLTCLLSVSALAGCGMAAAPASSAALQGANNTGTKLKVVTTIFPYYDFARAITGDTAELTMLLKPGAEAHSFDPSPADIINIENADVFIYTGGTDDAWADSLLAAVDTTGITVLRMLDTVPLLDEETVEGMQAEDQGHLQPHTSDEAGHEWDEHIWTSPKNAARMVDFMGVALQELAPQNASLYAKNASNYIAQIEELDTEFAQITANAQHKLMVFGDRFPFLYFVKEYGLLYRAAFPGCSTDTNPSAGTVAYLINTVQQNNLPYIFDIELSSGSIAAVIAEETGAEILTLQSCQTVSRQNFEAGETYVSLMRQNAKNLAKGLN